MPRRTLPMIVAMALAGMLSVSSAGCGASHPGATKGAGGQDVAAATGGHRPRPQAVEPTAGVQAAAVTPDTPIGDPNAHAPPLSQVRQLLKQELVAAVPNTAGYIDPLQYVNHWERTDQGVDANMPIGAPILAPCPVKILAVIPNWYVGQPLIYYELLNGPNAGKIQYVAEEITDLAQPGTILQQGQVIARYASSGTGIEFGWSTINGVTLAMATTGYGEGQATPAGKSIRAWLNSLGANAGSG